MEPVASEISNTSEDTIRKMLEQIKKMGSVTVFAVPSLSTRKRKQTLDKASEDNFSAQMLKKSDLTISESPSDITVDQEVITVKDNKLTSTSMNTKCDEVAHSPKRAKIISRAVQQDNNADMDNNLLNGRAKCPSPLLFTSDIEAEGTPETIEPQPCSNFSVLDDIPLDAKTVDPNLKPSHSETQSLQICECKISERKDTSLEKNSESDFPVEYLGPQLMHVSENSDNELLQSKQDVSPNLLFCKSSSKEVENITEPSSGMTEKEKQCKLSTKVLSPSADQKNPKSKKHSQNYSLRMAIQQPIRYISQDFSNVHEIKATKTQRKTVNITLPSLSSSAEKKILMKFSELARTYSCEFSVDTKTVDMPQIPNSALHAQNLKAYQRDFTLHMNKKKQLPSAKKELHTNKATNLQPDDNKFSQKNYLETLQAKLQTQGSRLEKYNKTC